MSTDFEILIGKTLTNVWLKNDKQEVIFIDSENNKYIYQLENDCCSEGWIEHISGVYHLPQKIISIDEKEEIEVFPTRRDEDKLYAIELKLEYYWIMLEFRNSSNGFYGSSINLISHYTPDKECDLSEFKEITEDF